MTSDKFAPIAIFAYKREASLRRLFASLFECAEFPHSAVTIFIDGPKDASDKPEVDQVRRYVSTIGLKNVSVVISDRNKGLRQSIYTGVSLICDSAGRVIVLEEDMTLSPDALHYFNSALDRYEGNNEIWAIVGYIYDALELRDYERALVLPFAHPWGWATWKRAWHQFSIDIQIEDSDIESPAFAAIFDLNGLYKFSRLLKLAKAGKVDSWFILWLYTIFKNGGRAVFPPRRLVDNHGLSDGTHGTFLNPYNILVKRPPLLTGRVLLPERVDVDYWALDKLKGCYDLRVQRLIAFAGYVKRLFRN